MRTHLSRARATALGLLAAVLLAAGCTGGDNGDLPAGDALLSSAAAEMAEVTSVGMRLTAELDLSGLPVREVDGVVTREGAAEGTAMVEQFGQLVEVRFVVVDDTFHFQLLGNWQELPREQVTDFYDPSAILDPDRGVAQLLRTAQQPEVVGRDGDRYQVRVTFDQAALAVLIPDAPAGVTGTLWIGVDRPLLHRAEVPLPEQGTVTVDLSRFDEPVTITAP